MMSVFDRIKASGLEYEHDMGSLLVPVCSTSDDLLACYPVEVWPFKGADKSLWYEVPAGYDPWFSQDGEAGEEQGKNSGTNSPVSLGETGVGGTQGNAGIERVPFAAW